MSAKIESAYWRIKVAVSNVLANSGAVDYRRARSGILHVPASATSTSVEFRLGDGAGNYASAANLVDNAGTAVAAVTVEAGKQYQLPHALFASGDFKIVSSADDSGLTWILELK